MANEYSVEELLDFLAHAGDRGLMPAATAQALAVASRNVFGVLADNERADLRSADLDAVVKRFTNKRAREFNPSSVKEYARRARRAMELFLQWRENPANFSVKTRTTDATKNKDRPSRAEPPSTSPTEGGVVERPLPQQLSQERGGFQSAFPIRPGRVVTISNIPEDLTTAEADRLAQFVRMLAVQ